MSCVLCSRVGAACWVLCVFLVSVSLYWNDNWDTLDVALKSRTSLEKDNASLRHMLDEQSRVLNGLRARNERLEVEARALARDLASRGEAVELPRDAPKADSPTLVVLGPQVSPCVLVCCESSVSRLVDAFDGLCWPAQTDDAPSPREACGSVPLPRFVEVGGLAARASVEPAGHVDTGLEDSVLALLLDCLV